MEHYEKRKWVASWQKYFSPAMNKHFFLHQHNEKKRLIHEPYALCSLHVNNMTSEKEAYTIDKSAVELLTCV